MVENTYQKSKNNNNNNNFNGYNLKNNNAKLLTKCVYKYNGVN